MEEKKDLQGLRDVLMRDEFLPICDRFDDVVKHIEEHKYYVNELFPWEITWEQAVFSWYENIFIDVKRILSSKVAKFVVGEDSNVEFYFKTMDHWHFMKKEGKDITYDEAAHDYIKKNAKPFFRWLRFFV